MPERIDFFESLFLVEDGVFQPRPETEILVEEAIKTVAEKIKTSEWNRGKKLTIVDACTGCGCIIISIALKFKGRNDIVFIGTDIDIRALKNAKQNAQDIKIHFVRTDLIESIKQADIIVSNPPYVSMEVKEKIKVHDPVHALFGGKKGYEITIRLIDQSSRILKKGGILIFETGYDDLKFFGLSDVSEDYKNAIITTAAEKGFKILKIIKDYAKIERIVMLEKI